MAASVTGLKVQNVAALDKDLTTSFDLTADHFANSVGPLIMVRPRVFGSYTMPVDHKPRKVAIDLGQTMQGTDSFDIQLPDGYTVDELPDPVKADVGFASYESSTKLEGPHDPLHPYLHASPGFPAGGQVRRPPALRRHHRRRRGQPRRSQARQLDISSASPRFKEHHDHNNCIASRSPQPTPHPLRARSHRRRARASHGSRADASSPSPRTDELAMTSLPGYPGVAAVVLNRERDHQGRPAHALSTTSASRSSPKTARSTPTSSSPTSSPSGDFYMRPSATSKIPRRHPGPHHPSRRHRHSLHRQALPQGHGEGQRHQVPGQGLHPS